MVKPISNRNINDFQLVSIGIELVHKIFCIRDCAPDLMIDQRFAKISELATKWNDVFINLVAKEGAL